jgi:hypothetical protein
MSHLSYKRPHIAAPSVGCFCSVFRRSGNVRSWGAMCAVPSTYCRITTLHISQSAMAEVLHQIRFPC